MIERHVGVLQQNARIRRVLWEHRYAETRFRECVGTVQFDRIRQRILDHFSDRGRIVRTFEVVRDDREFIAAKARNKAGLADPRHQTLCDALQKLVTSRMAMRIVEVLKFIETE